MSSIPCPVTLGFITMPGGLDWLLILLVALLLFGKNLPKVMRDLGRSVRTFKAGMGLDDPPAPSYRPPLSRDVPVDQDEEHLLPPQRPQPQPLAAEDEGHPLDDADDEEPSAEPPPIKQPGESDERSP